MENLIVQAIVMINWNNNKNGTVPDILLWVQKKIVQIRFDFNDIISVFNDLLQYIMCVIIAFLYDNKTM